MKLFVIIGLACLFVGTHSGYSQVRVSFPGTVEQTESSKTSNVNLEIIKITSPYDGSVFEGHFNVKGILKKRSDVKHLWLVVCPRESSACWPQYRELRPNKETGEWEGEVSIGGTEGKLIEIHLVKADENANLAFSSYIIESQQENKYPEVPMPLGTESLTFITVTKGASHEIQPQEVNGNYGFTKSGLFYIHKSLIEQAGGDVPCLVAGVTNWSKDIKMKLDGDYYIFVAKIDRPYNIKLEYCFYIGNGLYLPQLLIEKSSALIMEGDYKLNNTGDGSNFFTSPQYSFPGSLN